MISQIYAYEGHGGSGIWVDAYCLLERKEDDDLDRDDFDYWGILLQILTKLVEKLDLAMVTQTHSMLTTFVWVSHQPRLQEGPYSDKIQMYANVGLKDSWQWRPVARVMASYGGPSEVLLEDACPHYLCLKFC